MARLGLLMSAGRYLAQKNSRLEAGLFLYIYSYFAASFTLSVYLI